MATTARETTCRSHSNRSDKVNQSRDKTDLKAITCYDKTKAMSKKPKMKFRLTALSVKPSMFRNRYTSIERNKLTLVYRIERSYLVPRRLSPVREFPSKSFSRTWGRPVCSNAKPVWLEYTLSSVLFRRLFVQCLRLERSEVTRRGSPLSAFFSVRDRLRFRFTESATPTYLKLSIIIIIIRIIY